MNVIIYTRPSDGGLSICIPAEGARLAISVTLENGSTIESDAPQRADMFMRQWPVSGAKAQWSESEEEFIARIAKRDVPVDAVDVQIIDEANVPQDRTFRNGWKAAAGAVEHDMDKCREIHRDRLRVLRMPHLVALDTAFMRAMETGDAAALAGIAAQKQLLRDVTADQRIDMAITPEELKSAAYDIVSRE